MSVLRIILTILLVIDCIVATVIILMQEGKSAGLGAMAGQAGGDSYWNRNKNRSMEGKLVSLTRILVILFFVLSILLNLKVI